MATRNYQEIIFDRFNITTEPYIPADATTRGRLFNYYNPANASGPDTLARRPAFVWCHGGGGSLDDGRQWADMTRYGYPVFSIDYGESGEGFDPANMDAGIVNTLCFVRFLHSEHKRFGVNANLVIVTGTSFGGMIGLGVNAVQNKFKSLDATGKPVYPQFISPINDLYKKAKQNIFASACFPGALDGRYTSAIDALCSPVRAYHGDRDTQLPLSSIQKTIAQFQRMGVDALLKVYPGLTHKLEGAHDDIENDLVKQLATLMGIPLINPVAVT